MTVDYSGLRTGWESHSCLSWKAVRPCSGHGGSFPEAETITQKVLHTRVKQPGPPVCSSNMTGCQELCQRPFSGEADLEDEYPTVGS